MNQKDLIQTLRDILNSQNDRDAETFLILNKDILLLYFASRDHMLKWNKEEKGNVETAKAIFEDLVNFFSFILSWLSS